MKSLSLASLGITILTTSCATNGPKKVVSSHTSYNDTVQLTITREVLVNIVHSWGGKDEGLQAVLPVGGGYS